ncbi:hypothetical protein EW146_g764 [Bondarzewia mesenterica]|uniref:Eukaryotic translation initiation factor 3 subunit H n=1 Tax=Bondarzewia mesenterica TaxID=1095465 RepID=A0A4S4M620_9AGAM|nr:hypothetical protein EW146_g764 [Bondarzewia mesenterica]
MATSMAAALAASIPAPQAAPTPTAPTYEAIPASMSKVIDIEAEIPITSIQLDGMVVSKIIKHSSEAQSSIVHGLLLGLDLDGILEVSNSFPLPHHTNDDDEKLAKNTGRYQASMLRSLKEVRADDSVVGFYQSTTMGAFFRQTMLDTQVIHQERLRHGGVIIVHDVSQTARGNASFRAFRLSKEFIDAYKKRDFSSQSLIIHKLTFSSILEEIPLTVRTNPLLSAFINTISQPHSSPVPDAPLGEPLSALPPTYSSLDLGNGSVTKNLEHVIEALDNYKTEEGNLAYLSRQIAREKARADAFMSKRKEENAARVAQGLAPLPEEDMNRLFKIPPEPSRLESMLLLGQIDAYAKTLEGTASTSLVKMFTFVHVKCSHAGGLRTAKVGVGNWLAAGNSRMRTEEADQALSRRLLRAEAGFNMRSFISLFVALSYAISAMALAHPSVSHRLHARRQCSPRPASSAVAASSVASSSVKVVPSSSIAAAAAVAASPSSSVAAAPSSSVVAAPSSSVAPHSSSSAPTTTQAPSSTKTSTQSSAVPATAVLVGGAATTGSSSGLSFLTGTQTGQGTFYGTGLGACGITNTDTDYIAAVSKLLFDQYPGYSGANPNSNPVCGKQIKANYQGKSVTITVTDRCEACQLTDLDFSPSAFSQLADQSIGRISGMTWDWI